MTRIKCKEMLPIIEAFANGENVQYYDSLQITGTHTRGEWKTAENIGFGAPIESYRILKGKKVINFGNNNKK